MDLPTTKCIQIKYSDSLFAVKTGPDTSRACFDFSPTGTAVHYFPDSSLRLMARARVALKYETTVLSTRTSPAIRSPHTYLSSRLKKHMDLQKQGIKCAAPTQEERAHTGTHSADLGASLQTGGPYGHPVGTLYNVLVLSRVFIPRSTGYRTR